MAPLLEIAMRLKSHVALDADAAAAGTRLVRGFSTPLFAVLGARRATACVVFGARGTNVPIASPPRASVPSERVLERELHHARIVGVRDREAATLFRRCDVTLDAALDDVGAVFLVSVAPLAPAARAIERIASRTERLVFLSAPIRTNHPFFQQPNDLRQVYAGVEELIENSGVRSTMLRAGPFALNYRHWWGPQIRNGDVVRWFHGDAQTAAVHERDIAAVAVRALCDERHDRQDYVVTGPESLTQREQLAVIGDSVGRHLMFDEVSPDTARREVIAAWPPRVADMLLSAYAAAVNRLAFVTPTVEAVTGTPARTFREWANDHATDFAKA